MGDMFADKGKALLSMVCDDRNAVLVGLRLLDEESVKELEGDDNPVVVVVVCDNGGVPATAATAGASFPSSLRL